MAPTPWLNPNTRREREKDRLTDEFRLVINAAECYRRYMGRLLNTELWRKFPNLVKTVLGVGVVTPYLREHLLESVSLLDWAEFCKVLDFMNCLKFLSRR